MPDSIPDFNATCQVYERKLRALKRSILGILADGEAALEDETKIRRFKARLASCQSDWEQYQKAWDDRDSLQVHYGEPESWPDEAWIAEYNKVKCEIIDASAIMMEIDDNQAAKFRSVKYDSENVRNYANKLSSSMNHHLPTISIPSFSGDLLQWSHFKDTFVSMVHNENSISNVQKFHYLRSALKGEAAILISRIPISDESYAQAWSKLTRNYDNPRVLATLYIQRILECDAKSPKTELQRYENFLNGVADGIEGFRSLDIPEKTDFLLSALALRALDSQTRKHLELSQHSLDTAPTADEVIDFVRKRANAIKLSQDICATDSFAGPSRSNYSKFSRGRTFPQRSSLKYNPVNLHAAAKGINRSHSSSFKRSAGLQYNDYNRPAPTCPFCKGLHSLSRCQNFADLSIDRRVSFVNGWKGCRNCFNETHKVSECKSRWNCRFCNKRHHSLLHQEADEPNNAETPATTNTGFSAYSSGPRSNPKARKMVLLPTVQCFLADSSNGLHPARALVDTCSEQTFITKEMSTKLRLSIQGHDECFVGLGGNPVSPIGIVNLMLKPYRGPEEVAFEAVVVDQISPHLPGAQVSESILATLAKFDLADRSLGTPGVIDLLIGSDIISSVATGSLKPSPVGKLSFLPTIFGLAVLGPLDQPRTTNISTFLAQSSDNLNVMLKKFWELEEPAPVKRNHPDDDQCENHFKGTCTRTEEGRYMVRLPFKPGPHLLGDNRKLVIRRFLSLERRFERDSSFFHRYAEFMKEYRDLGHMSVAKTTSNFLIPHHGVVQGSKLRVVFDASCTPSSGSSLNDTLLCGPKLQKDICVILTRFRLYAIPLCADLIKIYRQIVVHPEDRLYQHILWRDSPKGNLVEWELNTVTYGVRASPYQALRVVQQLINDEGANFPLAAERASQDMFVDDIVSGADSLEEAFLLKEQLCGLFSKGGFSLSKWASTEPTLLPLKQGKSMEPVRIKGEDESVGNTVKILGLVWNPESDTFSYNISTPNHSNLTKRVVLSCVARIFDPLGFLSPVILLAKILLQETWKARLNWDEPLPPYLVESWNMIFSEWNALSAVSIPRYITFTNARRTLVGFCDASTKGYAAAVYLRSDNIDGTVKVSLIKAKTKVAPIKFVSIARLELCSAVLLARLVSSITIEGLSPTSCRCYTDSSNVLSWLRLPIHALKVFEANRVSQILDVTSLDYWGHIRSEENPCDIGSRGSTPSKIGAWSLWWHGPPWLIQPTGTWPGLPLMKTSTTLLATPASIDSLDDDWISRFSSFILLIRSTARILRFREVSKPADGPMSRPLSANDLTEARLRLIRLVQHVHLPAQMFSSGPTPREYQQLSPFLDEHGIVRVGGRLQHAPLSYSAKHPILIPANTHLAKLLIRDAHERNFHAGQSLVLALLRGCYWIPRCVKAIRKCIISCVHCRKLKAKPITPLMSPLPKDRFNQSRPFSQVGVDFAGPFAIKESSRRNASLGKAYLCVFVCLATRALHLEAVTSLSTAAFLSTFDRFASRRGLPSTVWSDNGTNFVGASRFIKDIYAFLSREEPTFTESLASRGVEWKFIPPRAPHFGGIWEAGVKSVKTLMTNTIGKQPYTFEELMTAFTRIEGLLNSRPLCALTDDVENFDFLTPGHFLIGAPISTLPEPSNPQLSGSIANRWNAMKTQIATVWERWRKEYLHSLQERKKWYKKTPNIKVGDLVILMERRLILGQWPVARVIETHPGRDGVTRTVVVRTPSGNIFVRAVTSIVPLFHDAPEQKSVCSIPLMKSED